MEHLSVFPCGRRRHALGEWPKLLRYLDSPYLTPDANAIEREIRPFVIGRNNWIFSGSPRGAYASATLYSLIQTARANGVEPYRYLRYLFTKLPLAQTREDYLVLTPQYLNQGDFEKSSLELFFGPEDFVVDCLLIM